MTLVVQCRHCERRSNNISVTLPITAFQQDRQLSQDDEILPAPLPSFTAATEALSSFHLSSPKPPAFSSLYFPSSQEAHSLKAAVTEAVNEHILSVAPVTSVAEALAEDEEDRISTENKQTRPRDPKTAQVAKPGADDREPPPPYTEGSSPLDSFQFVMAAAGGPSSIITQVQQSVGPPINTLGGQYCYQGARRSLIRNR